MVDRTAGDSMRAAVPHAICPSMGHGTCFGALAQIRKLRETEIIKIVLAMSPPSRFPPAMARARWIVPWA
jgi:hypothetical protein